MAKKPTFEFSIDGNLDKLKKLKEVIEEYKKHKVKVGVFGGNYPNGESYASVGMKHEFGSVSPQTFNYKGESVTVSGVPARSWLRVPVKKAMSNKGVLNDMARLKVLEELQNGKYEGNALEFIGIECTNEIKEAFASEGYGQWDKNINQKYIELKGGDRPLIDTGMLWQAVEYEIE